MKMNNKSNKEEILNRIISAAYRDASVLEMFKVFLIISREKEYKKEYKKYRKTALLVHSLKKENLDTKMNNEIRTMIFTYLEKIYNVIFVKPKYAVVLGSAILIFLLSTMFFQKNSINGYSKEEIKYAEYNVKYSFALLGKILNESKTIIKDGIVKNNLEKPINKSFYIIKNLNK